MWPQTCSSFIGCGSAESQVHTVPTESELHIGRFPQAVHGHALWILLLKKEKGKGKHLSRGCFWKPRVGGYWHRTKDLVWEVPFQSPVISRQVPYAFTAVCARKTPETLICVCPFIPANIYFGSSFSLLCSFFIYLNTIITLQSWHNCLWFLFLKASLTSKEFTRGEILSSTRREIPGREYWFNKPVKQATRRYRSFLIC